MFKCCFLCREHINELRSNGVQNIEKKHNDEFPHWFENKVSHLTTIDSYYVLNRSLYEISSK